MSATRGDARPMRAEPVFAADAAHAEHLPTRRRESAPRSYEHEINDCPERASDDSNAATRVARRRSAETVAAATHRTPSRRAATERGSKAGTGTGPPRVTHRARP